MSRNDQISNQDFQLVRVMTDKFTKDFGEQFNFSDNSIGFEFLVLERIFKLQDDEVLESITDSIFQNKLARDSGPDRGVDALIIDEELKEIHIFNFKYTQKDLSRVKDSVFPSGEINNLIVFIKDLYEKNEGSFLGNSANEALRKKVKEIWRLMDLGIIFKFNIYFVANYFKGFPQDEEERLKIDFSNYGNLVSFSYILVSDISAILTERKEKLDCKFRGLLNHFFDKSEYGRRALIAEISAIDLLRIVSSSSDIRNTIDIKDEDMLKYPIEESIFSDNVRVYLKQRTNVNKNIKSTALDEAEKLKIFFYNNGITVTCDKIDYQGTKSPLVTLTNLQVVNGGQTIHALRSAFEDVQEGFEDITLLCKIYETGDPEFKNKIAEYTNSQNPVSDRDIHSIDLVQIKLEKEFFGLGYFYERKRAQYESQERNKRIDAEKLGQILLAYNLEMPAEAKNRKSIIFREKYDEIFNDNLIASEGLKIFNLYKSIEQKKQLNILAKPYLGHATYYILFFIKKICSSEKNENFEYLYAEAVKKIELIITHEKEKLRGEYSDAILFKSSRPKEYLSFLGL